MRKIKEMEKVKMAKKGSYLRMILLSLKSGFSNNNRCDTNRYAAALKLPSVDLSFGPVLKSRTMDISLSRILDVSAMIKEGMRMWVKNTHQGTN